MPVYPFFWRRSLNWETRATSSHLPGTTPGPLSRKTEIERINVINTQVTRTLSANCSLEGAALDLSFDASEVVGKLQSELEKRLRKKGWAFSWRDTPQDTEVRIRFVEIAQGNRLLRYLLPFVAPALVGIEGELAIGGSDSKSFHYVQKAQVGLFGGSAKSMLETCAAQLANKIARDIQKAIG